MGRSIGLDYFRPSAPKCGLSCPVEMRFCSPAWLREQSHKIVPTRAKGQWSAQDESLRFFKK